MTLPKIHAARVVVADDSAVFRTTLVRFLSTLLNIQVIAQAADGQEALQVVATTDPDILILDIQMPTLNGIEVLQRLQAMQARVQVVVLSAHGDLYSELALANGATAFVSKGDIPRLIQTISTLIQGLAP